MAYNESMDYKKLPVYEHRDMILRALQEHQVIVVESPTGSGKTTQLPVILHEAGYSARGVIGVTQPRRIAAVSVSGFIRKQLADRDPDLVGYKMRFDDQTSRNTRIKIMTDGILLQEMKLDQYLSQYSVLMVDEAHERSLNIDFVLGLLKRVLEERPDFKVIVSSATINAQVFSEYFNNCPVVRIETTTFPVSTVYAPPAKSDDEALVAKVHEVVGHIMDENRKGDILVFMSGEKLIKDTVAGLYQQSYKKRIHVIPLYGRLSKEEQDLVFPKAPWGKTKIVVSTNIAETSLTIDGITSVIDSGRAKINFYNPRTYTSTLMEKPISKASANQRKGRAGRTQPGSCYRLYSKEDFESRPLFGQEEIYRTDLSEVVLRMAELGITNFDRFDFISSPGKAGIAGAVENLLLLDALEKDNTLSSVGKMMAAFPLLPRHSRIIVEAIRQYPGVIEEAVIATAFLSTDSPYLLPQGEELEARRAHHTFRDNMGDFMSYLKLYRAYMQSDKKVKFCEQFYLDSQSMAEIANIKDQLEQIVSGMGVPIGSGGPIEDYLCSVAKGLIQFVCFRTGKCYQSLAGEKVDIHPGSVMYRETPRYIVAGEIVRTSRMYARSVGALKREWLARISPELARSIGDENADHRALALREAGGVAAGSKPAREPKAGREAVAKGSRETAERAPREAKSGKGGLKAGSMGHGGTLAASGGPALGPDGLPMGERLSLDSSYNVSLAGRIFTLVPMKGKKKLLELSWTDAQWLATAMKGQLTPVHGDLRTCLIWEGTRLLDGEKLSRVLAISRHMDLPGDIVNISATQAKLTIWDNLDKLEQAVGMALKLTRVKKSTPDLGFLTLYTNQDGVFWLKPSKGYTTALAESLASLEFLADTLDAAANPGLAAAVGRQYRRLSEILDEV